MTCESSAIRISDNSREQYDVLAALLALYRLLTITAERTPYDNRPAAKAQQMPPI